jgi:hypothetical protein
VSEAGAVAGVTAGISLIHSAQVTWDKRPEGTINQREPGPFTSHLVNPKPRSSIYLRQRGTSVRLEARDSSAPSGIWCGFDLTEWLYHHPYHDLHKLFRRVYLLLKIAGRRASPAYCMVPVVHYVNRPYTADGWNEYQKSSLYLHVISKCLQCSLVFHLVLQFICSWCIFLLTIQQNLRKPTACVNLIETPNPYLIRVMKPYVASSASTWAHRCRIIPSP